MQKLATSRNLIVYFLLVLITCVGCLPASIPVNTQKKANQIKKNKKSLPNAKRTHAAIDKKDVNSVEVVTKTNKTKSDGSRDGSNDPKSSDTAEKTDNKKSDDQEASEKKSDDKKSDKKAEDKKDSDKDKDKDKKDTKAKKIPLTFSLDDSEIRFWIKLRMPEFFYGKNLRLLNDENPTDRILFFRHTLDLNMEYRYGVLSREYNVVFAKMTLRNKGIWGDPESIASTTQSDVKILDAVVGSHNHAIPRHFLWIRELWIQFALNDLLCLPFCNYHTFTVGAFPFELGRGIALGSAYSVTPADLGFYAENAIDQYAFGAKLSGDIIKDKLTYDLYTAILDNKSASFAQTNLKTRGQQFGHRNNQARGYGVINYLVAGRFTWRPVIHPLADIRVEPYGLFNHNPEQKIEFVGDAQSNLATLGIAAEHECGNWEWGFDTAFNFGQQTVFGWDRNVIQLENKDGFVTQVNSKVKQAPPGQEPSDKDPLALYIPANQSIINQSVQAVSQNGEVIGENSNGILFNDIHRFRNRYVNKYGGSMFVFDFSYYFYRPSFKVSGAFGFASGDRDPNKDLDDPRDSQVDGRYNGFIGLLEVYSGTRVKSAFLLSGPGKIPRILSFPSQEQALINPFPTLVSRFTNIIFVGSGFTWRPKKSCRKWTVNPNILSYWQEDPSRIVGSLLRNKIDRNLSNAHKDRREKFTSTFLGIEANIFSEAELIEDLRFFGVAALFIPGQHYKDIKGLPLNKAQRKYIDSKDKTGVENDRTPLLGDDPSFYLNFGLEYRF